MNVEIISETLLLDIYGFSGFAINQDYTGTAFKLMDRMWQAVKSNNLKHKGLNIWVYGGNEKIFAGIELNEVPKPEIGLERKIISLAKYAYYKHTGPYHLIKQVGQSMTTELRNRGYKIDRPYVEIYGHWTNDETKLETELMMNLE